MDEILAYCGLICQTCPIYLATRQEKAEEKATMKAEIARECREHYGMNYELEDITDCDGCRTEGGRLFSGCHTCVIRMCARQKGLENCAHCADYVCEPLEAHFKKDSAARTRLNAVRIRITQ
jgi:hypothetical protein